MSHQIILTKRLKDLSELVEQSKACINVEDVDQLIQYQDMFNLFVTTKKLHVKLTVLLENTNGPHIQAISDNINSGIDKTFKLLEAILDSNINASIAERLG